jgi:hypothetical protein
MVPRFLVSTVLCSLLFQCNKWFFCMFCSQVVAAAGEEGNGGERM